MARKALVVDDSRSIRVMLAYTLRKAGFEVVESDNGADGLMQLEKGPVDLIITDLNMPIMDGVTFIRALRARPENKTTPTLLLTTDGYETQQADARAAGATGWVSKPFQPDQLISVVTKLVP